MEAKRDGRRDVVMTDVEALVPKDHLLRKIEAVMDYEWLYERLSPYYCEDNGRPGIDPVDDGRIPIVPYTRYKGKKDVYKPWEFTYDEGQDCFICPQGCRLRHTTTSKDGKRFYRSTPKDCRNCPCREACGANAKGQRLLTTHIWQEYLDLAEQLRKSERGQEIYALRKETIERDFADAKDKHGMRYTHRRGLARVSAWVRLKFAAFNLKKLARWWALYSFAPPAFRIYSPRFFPFPLAGKGFLDRRDREAPLPVSFYALEDWMKRSCCPLQVLL